MTNPNDPKKVVIRTGKPGRPKGIEIRGGGKEAKGKPRILGATDPEAVQAQVYDRMSPPEQPESGVQIHMHDTKRSFDSEVENG